MCFNPKYSLNSTSAYALFNAETSASAWSSVVPANGDKPPIIHIYLSNLEVLLQMDVYHV